MGIRLSNNAQTTLSSAISATDTSITVADGSVFPALSGSDYTYVTLEDTSGNLEIVKVTAISSNTLTVTRGQDSTTARAFSSGDFVQLRVTAALLNDLSDEASVTLWADIQNKPDSVITLAGDASGSATMTDLGSATLTVTIADDSHNHVISNVDGLQSALDDLTPTSNDTFNGTYPLVWVASDVLYSSTFMTINGSTDTLSVPNISTSGTAMFGDRIGINGKDDSNAQLAIGDTATWRIRESGNDLYLMDPVSSSNSRVLYLRNTGTGGQMHVDMYGNFRMNGTTRINSVGDGLFTSLYIGSTNIVDTSRNLTNIGTISSGAITSSSGVTASGSIGNLTAGSLGQQMEKGDTSVTTLRFDADRWRLYAGNNAGEIISAYENGNVDFTTGNLLKNGTVWMDNSRNMSNIGTISSGAITSTGTSTFGGIRVNNLNTALSQGGGNALRIQTNSGYVEVGPRNTGYAHFNTDRAAYYFEDPVHFDAQIYNYVSGGTSDPYWRAGNDGSGSGLDADTLDGYQLSGATSVATKIFNNKGQAHSTYTDFNTVMTPGPNYIQGGTNGPTGTTTQQWYGFMLGLGSQYGTSTGTSNHYASQMYYPRAAQGADPYLYFRDLEGGSWGSWRKVYAGYADTAGSASQIDGWGFTNTGSNSGVNADTINSNGISYYTSGVTNFSGNATDGALYSQRYSDAWQHQIAADYRSGQIAVRGKNNGTWQSWYKVWSANNDGSGSGLDADTLDGFQLSSIPYATDGNSRASVNTANSAAGSAANAITRSCFFRDNNVDFAALGINVQHSTSDNYNFQFGVRSYSDASALRVRVKNNGTWGSRLVVWNSGNDGSGSGLDADLLDGLDSGSFLRADADNNITSYGYKTRFQSNTSGASTAGDQSGLEVFQSSSNSDAFMTFHVSGDFAGYFGLDGTTNDLFWGGWSRGAAKYKIWHAANDGSGSGLDADVIKGRTWSESVTANTLVSRQANGYIYANHINFSTSETENPTINSFFTSNGDGWSRKSSKSHVISQLSSGLLTHQAGTRQSINFNSYLTQGFYNTANNNTNKPSGAADYAQLIVAKGIDTGLQIYGGYANTALYWRGWASSGSTFYNWHKLWSDQNDGSGSGLDADTVDGIQGANIFSTSTAPAGNVRIASGNGYGLRFWDSNNYKIYMSSTGDGSWGGRVTGDTTSDYNMYFRMAGGTNRGFVFRDDSNNFFSINPDTGIHSEVTLNQTSGSFVSHGFTTTDLNTAWQVAGTGKSVGIAPFRYQNSASNKPESGDNAHWGLNIWAHGGSSGNYPYGHQLSAASSGNIWQRWVANGSFGGWRKIFDSGNDGSGSGLDADMLDGVNGASYLRSDAADTLTANIVAQGDFVGSGDGYRDHGVYGNYNSYRIHHMWGMGTAYRINVNGSDFGNLYGCAYTYHNRVYTSNSMAGHHQMVWCQNGSPNAALGSNIWTSGNVIAYSDIRVKTNLEVIPDALSKVQQLNGYTFDRTDVKYDEEGNPTVPVRQTGVVAQEVLEVLPEAVTGDEESHYNVAYGNMVGLLIEAIKELKAEVDDLKAQLEEDK